MTLKKISLDEFMRLRKLVHRSARPLDYTKWKFLFENGSCDECGRTDDWKLLLGQ